MNAKSWIVAAVISLGVVGIASAEPPRGPPPRGFDHPRGWDHMDNRFGHAHYYPSRGYVVRDLPRDRLVVRGGFYYSGGVWYSHRGPTYVVVAPPIGVYVPILPTAYTTVYFGGVPYYYANDTYYQWVPNENQYEVVAPPGDDSTAQMQGGPPPPGAPGAAPSAPGADMFIYPKNGQTEEQQSTDKYECHKWANQQSGFDPTQSGGGVPPEQNAGARDQYNRAMTACLEGRGYSVK